MTALKLLSPAPALAKASGVSICNTSPTTATPMTAYDLLSDASSDDNDELKSSCSVDLFASSPRVTRKRGQCE